MRYLFLFAIAAITTACATGNSFRTENRMNLLRVSPGMSKDQVLQVMGIGEHTLCCPVRKVTNPYRTESFVADGARFEVLYYLTDQKTDRSDDVFSQNASRVEDEELLPIVLKDGRVEGWGWSFWTDTVQRYEIRVKR